MLNEYAGNDLLKFYLKWRKNIRENKDAFQFWYYKWNSYAIVFLESNKPLEALKAYWESIKLNPFWRGNYIDILKNLPKIIKLMITNK